MTERHTRIIRAAFAFGLALLLAGWISSANLALAAVVADCRLVMDGSSDPPGDRVLCAVQLLADEKPARVELRAYLVPAKPAEQPSRVKAATGPNRDAEGNLLVAVELPEKPESEISLIVPYADLALPVGQYEIGYQVTLLVKGQRVWTQALPATRLRVSEGTREHVRPQLVGGHAEVTPGAVKAYVRGKSSANAPTSLMLDRHPSAASAPAGSEAKRAEVPGGFERAALDKTPVKQTELEGLAGQPWRPLSSVADARERVVYFATNRQPLDPPKDGKNLSSSTKFGSDLSDKTLLGKCTVNFPVRHHRLGELLTPSWWNTPDPEQFFLIDGIQQLTAGELTKEFGAHDILLFVHGYSNTFEDAVLRAGQLQYDVDFPGSAIAFCWPADGSLSPDAYKLDVQNAEKSVRPLADVLEMLTKSAKSAGSPPAKVHVIAHSLGNRLFLAALHDLAQRGVWKPGQKYLGQVVLAAPDVGAARFNNVLGYATAAAERLTYYYCRTDKALVVSQSINSYEPVGLYPYFDSSLDTINADGVGTDFISHSYYGSSPRVLADLHLLLCSSFAPAKRMPPLSSHSTVYGHEHWSFLPVVIEEQ